MVFLSKEVLSKSDLRDYIYLAKIYYKLFTKTVHLQAFIVPSVCFHNEEKHHKLGTIQHIVLYY